VKVRLWKKDWKFEKKTCNCQKNYLYLYCN